MREKKLFITLALILGVLLLGIVYAAINTQTLNIVGGVGASASAENFEVNFRGQAEVTKSETVGTNANTATVTSSTSGKNATFSISGLDTKGEYVKLSFPIWNTSADLTAELSNIQITTSDTNKTWWDITASFGKTTLVPVEGRTYLHITVTLKDTPATDTEAPEGIFNVTFTADPA